MTHREYVLKAISHEQTDRIPYTLGFEKGMDEELDQCGSFSDILPDIIEIGLDVIESVQPEPRGMDPFELKRRFGSEITFWGCLGSQSTIPFGTPDEIRARVEELCRVMGRGGGYILAPAKEIQPGTPASNSAAVLEAFARNNL